MKGKISLEKPYFHMILENPTYFKHVDDVYFKDDYIKEIYSIVKQYYQENPKKQAPSLEQIYHLANSQSTEYDHERTRLLLNENLTNFDADWLNAKFKTWLRFNEASNKLSLAVDEYRKIKDFDDLDQEKVDQFSIKIRDIFSNIGSVNLDEDLGLDFDDPNAHIQALAGEKITTGFASFDKVLGGGWDRKTLNVLMGMTGSGKSVWMNNLAVNAADAGYNVAYVTLEMSDRKIVKRLGSIRLNIPINEYDRLSTDQILIKKKLKSMYKHDDSGDIFEKKLGKIFIKEFAISSASPEDIDHYIQKLEESKGIKIDILFIDYLGIMGVRNLIDKSLYGKGKYLAEGSRSIGQKRNLAVVTAVQVSKDAWGTNSIALSDTPESKAIPETADTQFGILRPTKINYALIPLKLRDVEFVTNRIEFDFNQTYLRIENDRVV